MLGETREIIKAWKIFQMFFSKTLVRKKTPSLPNFYQPEDLGTSNHGVLSLGCSCVNNSFLEPEKMKLCKRENPQ